MMARAQALDASVINTDIQLEQHWVLKHQLI